MGTSMGCVFREDEDTIEPVSNAFSFWEASKHGERSEINTDRATRLPVLLLTQSNLKLHDATFNNDTFVPLSALAHTKQSNSPPAFGWKLPASERSVPNSGRKSIISNPHTPRLNPQQGLDALARLRQGNQHFLASLPVQANNEEMVRPIVSILCCTPLPIPIDVILGIDSREIACLASASLHTCIVDDCGAAALEFSMVEQKDVPLVLVVETIAMNETEIEAKNRVFRYVEKLLANSKRLCASIENGLLVKAALLELKTGQVHFLADHRHQKKIFGSSPHFGHQHRPSFFEEKEVLEKESMPAVPAEEALAILQVGNLRASSKPSKQAGNISTCSPRIGGDHDDSIGHNPFAIILTSFDPCKDEGPPVEVLFDLHPSEVCAISTIPIPNDGSEETYADCTLEEQWKGHVHLVEQVLATTAPRFILVLGRVAVDATRGCVCEAKESVFNDMWKMLSMSTIVKAAVADGQMHLLGAIYHGNGDVNMPPGEIEWLGGHPLQDSILAKMASAYPPSGVLSEQDAVFQLSPTPLGVVDDLLNDLFERNERVVHGDCHACNEWQPLSLVPREMVQSSPKALILSGALRDVRAPERLLDARPGEFLVHRTCGAIGGRSAGCSIRFLEGLLDKHPNIPLLFILGDICDPVISRGITQVQTKAKPLKQSNAQKALEQVTPAVIHALECAQQKCELADLTDLTTELHIRYVMERLLVDSDLIIDRVANGHLDVQGAIVQPDGRLRRLGGPDVHRLIGQKARVERHRRKGVGLGRSRTKGRQFVYSPRS